MAKWSLSRAIVVMGFWLATTQLSGQECDICVSAIREQYPVTFISQTDNRLSVDMDHFFCSDEFEKRARNDKAGVTVPIEGAPVLFSKDSGEAWGKRRQICERDSFHLSSQDAAKVYLSFVPETVQLAALEKWGECVSSCNPGGANNVTLTTSKIDDRQVLVTVARKPNTTAAKVSLIVLRNLDCKGKILTGSAITHGGLGSVCTISNPSEDATIAVVPSYGSPVKKRFHAPPVAKPLARSVEITGTRFEGDFDCGHSMTCADHRVLNGVKDGTSCQIRNSGRCGTVLVLDQFGKEFSAVRRTNVEEVPGVDCGKTISCPDNKVIVGFKDGTSCEVLNTIQCSDLELVTDGRKIVLGACQWTDTFACGDTGVCGPDQVAVAMLDGTGCEIRSKVKCCALTLK
jgi:hypothetical protein